MYNVYCIILWNVYLEAKIQIFQRRGRSVSRGGQRSAPTGILQRTSRRPEKDKHTLQRTSRMPEKDKHTLQRKSRMSEKDKNTLQRTSRMPEKDKHITSIWINLNNV